VSLADTGSYQVVAIGACCNDTSNVVRIDVDLKPMVVAMNDTTIFSGESVTLEIIESVGTVHWRESDMETVVLNPLITNIMESVQFVAIARNGVCPEEAIAPVQIIVDGSVCLVRTRPDLTICAGEPHRLLIDTATVEYRWYIAGTTTVLPQFSIVRPTETMRIVLVGYNEDDEVCGTDTLVLTVPEIQLDVRSNAAICRDATIELYSNPPADSWLDENNNTIGYGNISVAPPPGVTTIYTALRTAYGCTVRKTVSIATNPPDLHSLLGDSIRVCEGEQVHLQTNIAPNLIYWERLSTSEILDKDPFIIALEKDVFRAHAWDVACGPITIDVIVDVQPRPTFEIFPHETVCVGTSVHFTSVPNASQWTLLDGTRVFMPIIAETTQEYIGIFILDQCTVTDTVILEVDAIPSFAVAFRDTTVVQGTPLELVSTPLATQWFIEDDGHVLTLLTVYPDKNMNYIAQLETQVCGILFDTIFVIAIEAPDTLQIWLSYNDGCVPGEGWAQVEVLSGVPPFTYEWSNGLTTSLIDYLQPGTYTVTVRDSLGGEKTALASILPVEELRMTYTTDEPSNEACDGGNIRTTIGGGTPPYFLSWNSIWYGDDFSGGQHLTNVQAGPYNLSVVDSRGCEKLFPVALQCQFRRVMPNLFISPNGDNMNDVLFIRHIELYPINRVTIINSFGEEIISFINYNNRDIVWDGRNRRGQVLPDGTYYYVVEAKGVSPMAGWVLMKLSSRR
jgi:gliding motility-associated-like protein